MTCAPVHTPYHGHMCASGGPLGAAATYLIGWESRALRSGRPTVPVTGTQAHQLAPCAQPRRAERHATWVAAGGRPTPGRASPLVAAYTDDRPRAQVAGSLRQQSQAH
jgi:hypothetical protein